jgi:membrane protein implicated in regulation of membrane protease activity
MSYALMWLIIAVFTLVTEIISLGLTSIWFTVGAAVAAIAALLGAKLWLQILLFMVISTVMLVAMRPIAKKYLKVGSVKTNAESYIGRIEKVRTTIDNDAGTGMLKMGDVEWRAVSEDGSVIPEGTYVKIQKIEGTKLFVIAEAEG